MIGKKINGRYQILSELGDGGMAIVYKARDLILNRLVAVKVLRNEFSRDEEFIKRFHREAESVASLSHPNIVSIYDIGEEDDCYYIVMEYVKGTTLKSLIKHYSPLPFEESIFLLKQIMSAIDHAHQNGIVHRDIKPHNILIDENDHIKVTDFGIAVAMTSATITYTNSIMGSAHYLSPEQAKGGKTTFKSDIYSLGIVMFEMFTGELPYAGNSPVTVALKHLNEIMPRPKDINSAIPQSLENITMKSLAKDPNYRYDHVSDIYNDLSTALDPDRLDEERIIIPDDRDNQETKIIPPILSVNDSGENSKDKPVKKRKKSKVIWLTLILFFMIAGAAVASFTFIPRLFYVPNVNVPNEVGKHFDTAYEDLRTKNLKVDRRSVYDDKAAKGTIARQDPTAKTVVKENTKVILYVSNGPPKETVKTYIGYQKSTVQDLLQNTNYKKVKYDTEHSDTIPEGQIFKQTPKPSTKVVPQDTVLELTVSSGPSKVEVPDVTSKTQEEAQAIFDDAGLKVDFKEEYSDVVQKGNVIRQDPPPLKDVIKGSMVTVWISKGMDQKAVQDNIHISVPYKDQGKGKGNKKPEHVKIIYTDSAHPNETTFIKEEITKKTDYELPVTINPGDSAHYQVLVDNEVIFEDTVNYSDVQQTGVD